MVAAAAAEASTKPAESSEVDQPRLSVSDDVGEEAEVASPRTDTAEPRNDAPVPADEEGYVWPEGAEAQAETLKGEEPAAVPAEEVPLPKLDELTKRIPAAVMETLDDLFRARFVSVRRVSPKSLKSA